MKKFKPPDIEAYRRLIQDPCIRPPFMGQSRVKRFWEHVNKDAPDTCWSFYSNSGILTSPIYRDRNTCYLARSVAFYDEYLVLPSDRPLILTCENSRCVNPAHIVPKPLMVQEEGLFPKQYRPTPDLSNELWSEFLSLLDIGAPWRPTVEEYEDRLKISY